MKEDTSGMVSLSKSVFLAFFPESPAEDD